MKKKCEKIFFVIITWVVVTNNVYSNDTKLDSLRYISAFKYIKSNSELLFKDFSFDKKKLCICSSDTVIHMTHNIFTDSIITFEYKHIINKDSIRNDFLEEEFDRKNNGYSYKSLLNLNVCKNPDAIVFFSKPYKNRLLVNICEVDKYNFSIKDYDLSISNRCVWYTSIKSIYILFIFNERSTIMKVFHSKIAYD